METLAQLIGPFAKSIASGRTEIYNEFSLQHELGVFVRGTLADHRVQFERNVAFFFSSTQSFTKREIDISIFSPDKSELTYAIELKYPRNGQYPEQMFSFCKDIAFAEELHNEGFCTTGLVVFADDRLFYSGPSEGIYGYFRGGRTIHGRIQKPTGRKDAETWIRGSYSVKWNPVLDALKYAVIEVLPGHREER